MAFEVIYLGIFKAFNRFPPPCLISEGSFYRITDRLLSWLPPYLNQKLQVASIDGTGSYLRPVTSGVIKGGVFSTLSFPVDISDALSHDISYLFADDLTMDNSLRPNEISAEVR